jgi:hypothetical protein
MTTETKLRGGIVSLLLTLLWITVMWSNSTTTVKTQQKTIDSLSNKAEDLRHELFRAEVEIGRHEITREEILVPHKELNKQYEEYYTNQTE